MKKIPVSFNGVPDTTGYLFSLAKCFAAVLNSSDYKSYAEDIIAASGFAFRMWVDASGLCPSAASIWEFRKQPEWFGTSGLVCGYTERLWGQDAVEEERRLSALEQIRESNICHYKGLQNRCLRFHIRLATDFPEREQNNRRTEIPCTAANHHSTPSKISPNVMVM